MAKIAQQATDSINGLIALLHDGLGLHEKAMNEVEDTTVKQLSQEMIAERRRTIEELKPLVIQGGGEPTSRGTFVGDARVMIAGVKAMIGDRETAYTSELARLEDMTVSTIDTCMEDSADRQITSKLAERKQTFSKAAEKLRKLRGAA